MDPYLVTIPGTPVAQGRPRIRVLERNGKHIPIAYDPKKSRDWKATAQAHMLAAREAAGAPCLTGPVQLSIGVIFGCPLSQFRKKGERGPEWWAKKPDIENVYKAVGDAGNGVLWMDDRLIVAVSVLKIQAPQGAMPRVFIRVAEPPTDWPANYWTEMLGSRPFQTIA